MNVPTSFKNKFIVNKKSEQSAFILVFIFLKICLEHDTLRLTPDGRIISEISFVLSHFSHSTHTVIASACLFTLPAAADSLNVSFYCKKPRID